VLRVQKIFNNLRGLLDTEDFIVLAMPWLIALIGRSDAYLAVWEAYKGFGGLNLSRLVPFLLFGSGFWLVTASRHRHREEEIWSQLHIWAAWAGLLVGVPLLFVILSDGDTGIIYIYGALFAIISFGCLFLSTTSRALDIPPERQRLLLIPFLAISTWYATDRLVGQFLYEPQHVAFIVEPLRAGDPVGVMMGGIEALFMAGLMIVPYVLLVVFPRFIVGDVQRPGIWIRRYGWFVASILLGLAVICLETLRSGAG